jgi:Domain of unknown function (DUF1996)
MSATVPNPVIHIQEIALMQLHRNALPSTAISKSTSYLAVASSIALLAAVAPLTATARDLAPVADRGSGDDSGNGYSLSVSSAHPGLLRFDLSGVEGEIVQATLAVSVSGGDMDSLIAVNPAHDRWNEKGATGRSVVPANIPALGRMRIARDERLLDVTDYVRAEARSDGLASFAIKAASNRPLRLYSRESGRPPLLLLKVKSASQPPAARAPAGSGPWTPCANEGQRCRLPAPKTGAREVRYGTQDAFITRRVSLVMTHLDTIGCDNGTFGGDPAPGKAKTCVYGPLLTKTLAAPMFPMGPDVKLDAIPIGDPGTTQALFKLTTEQRGGSDGTGAFRTVCSFSHMNFDDPIVYPGQVGRSHLHAYFGNTAASAHSTAWTIANTGNSTCRGGILNRSSYWVPAIVDTRNGVPVTPSEMLVYYKTGYGGVPPQTVKVPPAGLRMIAGDMMASSRQNDHYGWYCSGVSHPLNETIPQNCTAGEDLVMVLGFPQCWDGVNLDSPNHKSHMAYPVGNDSPLGNGCPASHPVPLPEITYNVRFPVTEAGSTATWRLSSDMYANSIRGGYSAHGDWFNGWEPDALRAFVINCDNAAMDCHAHLLGDGREIIYEPHIHQIDPILLQRPRNKPRPR